MVLFDDESDLCMHMVWVNIALSPDMVAYIMPHGFDIVDLSVELIKISRDLRMKML